MNRAAFELAAAIAFQTQEQPVIETTAELALIHIVVDPSIQPREQLNEEHILDLMNAYELQKDIHKPTVYKIDGKFKLCKGFHRLTSMKRLKCASAEFIVKEGTEEQCAIESLCSNQTHGLKRSKIDKRRCVGQLLKLKPEWSDPKLADAAGVGSDLVAELRKGLEECAAIPKVEEREGRDGKLRKSVQTKIPNVRLADVGSERDKTPAPKPVSHIVPPEEDDDDPLGAFLGDPEVWETAPLPVDEPTPQVARQADAAEPQIDSRFMRNAEDAKRIADGMRDLKKRIEIVASDLQKLFGDEQHVVANRADLPDMLSKLKSVSETLGAQLPECVCPRCVGTTTLPGGDPCPVCDHYGLVDRNHYENNKSAWKKTYGRYAQLISEAV